jgi:DNA-binding FadR family transcriptional regulator
VEFPESCKGRDLQKNRKQAVIAEQHVRIFEEIKDGDSYAASSEAIKHIDFEKEELRRIISESDRSGDI